MSGLLISPTPDRGDDQADLNSLLDRLSYLVHTLEAACQRVGPPGVPAVLAAHRAQLYAAMMAVGDWINDFLAGQPSDAEIRAAKDRIVPQIRDWARTGQFFHRVYERAHEAPGAYTALEILYAGQPAGGTLSALIFDDYFLNLVSARAVRNRLTYLVRRLGAEVQACGEAGVKRVRILSLGSGAVRELVLLTDDSQFSAAAAITCVDADPGALRYARRQLAERLQTKPTCLLARPAEFPRRPDRPTQPFHIIYAAEQLNTLDDSQAAQWVQDIYEMLLPGGLLILGNLCTELPANERILSEWVLDWQPYRRDATDLQRIFARTPLGGAGLQIDYEPLHGYIFALARRAPHVTRSS